MKKYRVMMRWSALCLAVAALLQGCTNGSQSTSATVPIDDIESLFDASFQAQAVTILSKKEAQQKNVPFATVRNPNRKLALMAKDENGQLQPFYLKGIECGFWDTRRGGSADYNKVFDAYNQMGANTVMFMIHWSDIELKDGEFDFSYTDSIVEKAKNHGLKIVWILFMHEQFDMPFLSEPEEQWMYNLDTRDSDNYAIQWVKYRDGDISRDIATQRAKNDSEIMPCYSNPEIYSRIVRMLGKLAARYADSETVIGVQIGNEEHFSYQGEDADYNPYTLALFDKWKEQTGDTSWTRFKMDMVNAWFSRFTTVWHQQAPYQITMINPIGGTPEKGEKGIIDKTGTDATTFRDSKVDAIATMFYGTSAGKVWKNLDQVYRDDNTYSYPTRLPMLISTEIGIRAHTLPVTQEYMTNFIERGSPGFAVFSYGSVGSKEGEINEAGTFYRNFMAMVTANEDIIWPGLPGTGENISITATYGEGKVSCLHVGNDATLGILHFPDDISDRVEERRTDIPVQIIVQDTGEYAIDVYKDGDLTASYKEKLISGKGKVVFIDLSNKEAAFIKVTKQ